MAADSDALKNAAKVAWLFCLPLVEIATVRARGLMLGSTMNAFGHMRRLADHRARVVTTPNNDTLYSSAQLDLSAGPISITLPPSGDRYLSLALMDAYTNNFAILGTRTTGSDGGTFRLVGPNDAAEGPNIVRSPTNNVWALARILVAGPDDLEAAQKVQQAISMQGPAAAAPEQFSVRSAPWQEYFASAARLMAQNPPPVTDNAVLAQMAPLGLADFNPSRFSAAEAAAIEAGVKEARAEARRSGFVGGAPVDGWFYPRADLGNFGQDYAYRAAIAVSGLAALPPIEALYMRAHGALPGGHFDGAQRWRLHFPADRLPAVHSFWSLSLYEATDDGQFFFTENELNRFAIGDRTPGLRFNDDGSLDIHIAHDRPEAAAVSNWLPAPRGPFSLFLRAYLPSAEFLDGRYRLPPVVAA